MVPLGWISNTAISVVTVRARTLCGLQSILQAGGADCWNFLSRKRSRGAERDFFQDVHDSSLILLQGVAFLHRAPGILGDAVQGRWIRHGVMNSNCEFGVIGRRGEKACFAVRYYFRNAAGIRHVGQRLLGGLARSRIALWGWRIGARHRLRIGSLAGEAWPL